MRICGIKFPSHTSFTLGDEAKPHLSVLYTVCIQYVYLHVSIFMPKIIHIQTLLVLHFNGTRACILLFFSLQ